MAQEVGMLGLYAVVEMARLSLGKFVCLKSTCILLTNADF
jgi:hypothetical protein